MARVRRQREGHPRFAPTGTGRSKTSLTLFGSNAFVKSFGEKYGFPPSQAAHTCYVQTMLYADAVTRAKSFDPCAVVEALEGFEFDGLGNGPTLYRAEDHQCFKDVLVVRGKENPTSNSTSGNR
jgi:branched-chain amino acid transport system substrate-binding protein